MNPKDLDRFLARIVVVRHGRWICEEWRADEKHDNNGYGRFWFQGQWRQAHRIAFEWITKDGRLRKRRRRIKNTLDHRCNNRACVRRSHLQDVTLKRNHELRVQRYWEKKR